VRIPLQKPSFDAALTRFLDDTLRRDRRRKRLWRFAALLTCSLLAYEWPSLHSSTAVAMATKHDQSGRVALFARPELGDVIAQAGPAELDLQRLTFVSMGAFAQSQVAQPSVAIAAAAVAGE